MCMPKLGFRVMFTRTESGRFLCGTYDRLHSTYQYTHNSGFCLVSIRYTVGNLQYMTEQYFLEFRKNIG